MIFAQLTFYLNTRYPFLVSTSVRLLYHSTYRSITQPHKIQFTKWFNRACHHILTQCLASITNMLFLLHQPYWMN